MATGRWWRSLLRALLFCAPLSAVPAATWAQETAGAARGRPQPTQAQSAQSQPAQPQAAAVEAAPKGDRTRTRFIIGLERAVDFQIFSRSWPRHAVVIDLPDVKVEVPLMAGQAPVGLVSAIQDGLVAPGKMRVIIGVTEPVIVQKARIEGGDGPSPRLVLDLVAAEPTRSPGKRPFADASIGSLGAASIVPDPEPVPQAPPVPAIRFKAAKSYKPVVVLDPGHGGMDSGALRNGAIEKDVVLAFSLKLRDTLNAGGRYKVMMTRDTDVFVELNARREFAERHQAALFVAVHADYAHARARGATIYSLRQSVANSLQRSVRGEQNSNILSEEQLAAAKQVEGIDLGIIRRILGDLVRDEVGVTRDRTSVFVKSVIENMGESTNMKDNPDRTAAFVVLKSAKVPSILIELGYVSNAEDAELLKSDAWREKVAASIATAIDNYFSHQGARLPMLSSEPADGSIKKAGR